MPPLARQGRNNDTPPSPCRTLSTRCPRACALLRDVGVGGWLVMCCSMERSARASIRLLCGSSHAAVVRRRRRRHTPLVHSMHQFPESLEVPLERLRVPRSPTRATSSPSKFHPRFHPSDFEGLEVRRLQSDCLTSENSRFQAPVVVRMIREL